MIRARALLALILLAGCSAEQELTRLDPALTDADLRQGRVAVLGVVKIQEPDQVRPPLIAMLERTWREERPDVPLVNSDSVRLELGPERDRRLLLQYEYQGELDDSELAEIADSLQGTARFLLAARVERERIRSSTRGINASDTTASRVGYAMGVTGRDARVAVHLYDLARRTLAVSARFEGSSENESPVRAPIQGRGPGGVNVEIKGSESQDSMCPTCYPGAPELALALAEPFRNFARMLPGAPRPVALPPPTGRR